MHKTDDSNLPPPNVLEALRRARPNPSPCLTDSATEQAARRRLVLQVLAAAAVPKGDHKPSGICPGGTLLARGPSALARHREVQLHPSRPVPGRPAGQGRAAGGRPPRPACAFPVARAAGPRR
jgi:hypothetical protein